MKVRAPLAGVLLGAAVLGSLVGSASADIDDYNNNPGRLQATEVGAQCGMEGVSGAGSGAFGYFGKDNNKAGGADGTQTGLNNSALCGNRQGNLP